MNKLDSIYRLHHLLDGRRTGIARAALAEQLGVSSSTLARHLGDLRDKFGAPLIHDAERGGYLYHTADGRHHLPGLWFTADELAALVVLQSLLAKLQPGLLDDYLAPLKDRVERILASEHLGSGEAAQRIRILGMATRGKTLVHFQTVAGAVLHRHRLAIDYYVRERDETTHREISPQRLTHYRDNWYLDAWCHGRKALRVFAVECIRAAHALPKPAKTVPDKTLDRELGTSYGIFAGRPVATAVLVFTARRARWVADEAWHPEQQTRWLEDGRYELRVPYSDDRELLMDVLKYGADLEVVAPIALREAVEKAHEAAASQYRRGTQALSGFENGDD